MARAEPRLLARSPSTSVRRRRATRTTPAPARRERELAGRPGPLDPSGVGVGDRPTEPGRHGLQRPGAPPATASSRPSTSATSRASRATPRVGYTYDPARARQILAEGGWACPQEGVDGVCTKDGIQARFELLVRPRTRRSRTPHAGSWPGPRTSASRSTCRSSRKTPCYDRNYKQSPEDTSKYEPDYDAFLWGWAGDLPSPDFNFEVTLCGGYWSDTFYCNPEEYDPIPTQALQELDFDRRVAT